MMSHYTMTSLTITEWIGSYGTRYMCLLFYDDGKAPAQTRELSVEEARLLQWELLRKGAVKTTSYNPYCPHIFTRNFCLIKFS